MYEHNEATHSNSRYLWPQFEALMRSSQYDLTHEPHRLTNWYDDVLESALVVCGSLCGLDEWLWARGKFQVPRTDNAAD